MNIYQRAWELLLGRLSEKTSWGRVELQRMMLECLIQAGGVEEAEE